MDIDDEDLIAAGDMTSEDLHGEQAAKLAKLGKHTTGPDDFTAP